MNKKSYHRPLIYWLVFILSLADAVAGYVQSSFLNQFFSLANVGLIIALAGAAALMSSLWLSRLIARFSLYRLGLGLALVNTLCATVLAMTGAPILASLFFLVRSLCFTFLLIVIDILLENISTDKITGSIRSLYLTVINLAWLAAPYLMGSLVGANHYDRVYWFGAGLTALWFFIFFSQRRRIKTLPVKPTMPGFGSLDALKELRKSRDLKAAFGSVIALNIFYATAVLYIPIYLNQNLGFTWPVIGVMFTFMLIPFVVLQFPAGLVADKYLGEKEILMAGNIIMAGVCAIIFLSHDTSVLFWIWVLVSSRIGAALAESMQEVYFYKKVNARHVGLINFFRQARSLGWLLGALLSFALLKFTAIPGLFLVVAAVLTANTVHLMFIQDTK